VYVLFQYPTGNALSGSGYNGGSGIGYSNVLSDGTALLGHGDGAWIQVHRSLTANIGVTFESGSPATVLGTMSKADAPQEDLDARAALRTRFERAYPNPFNPETSIEFSLAQASTLELVIYNVRGELVSTLRAGHYPTGNYRVRWNATDSHGVRVASGVYLATLRVDGEQFVKRLVLAK
jgi:hypothetical protein